MKLFVVLLMVGALKVSSEAPDNPVVSMHGVAEDFMKREGEQADVDTLILQRKGCGDGLIDFLDCFFSDMFG